MEYISNINTIFQVILGLAAITGIFFGLRNLLNPVVKLSIISYYSSLSKECKLQAVFKLKTDSTADLIIEDLKISANTNHGKVELDYINIRWKGFLPVMKDNKGVNSYYALTGPIYPNLYTDGIKSGINQCYISLVSSKGNIKDDINVNSLNIKIELRSPLVIAPQWLTRKTRTFVIQLPEDKYLYFDDSIIKKITKEQREKIMDGL